MRSVYRTLVFSGLAAAVLGAATGAGIARAETSPENGTLNAQYAALTAPRPAFAVAAAPNDLAPPAVRAPAELAGEPAGAPGPSVALAHRLIDAAAAYAGYMRQAAAIQPGFHDGDAVRAAVRAGASYEPVQLEEGATAFAALVALQDPMFVQGVRDWAAQSPGEASALERLYGDPSQVLATPGAPGAAALASAALRAQGLAVLAAGKAVKQAAYGVQHEAWSKQSVADAAGRLAGAKAQSSAVFHPGEADVAELLKTAVAFRRDAGGAPSPGAVTPTVARALALAAAAVLGGAGEEQAERLTPLLSPQAASHCVKMAKLNLFQCLSVAGPEYEDVFCLGQHAMMDTGRCMVEAAGAPAAAPTQLADAAPPASRSVMVPIAMLTGGR